MARPQKFKSKTIIVSISCSPEEKQFLEMKGISPTQLFREAIKKLQLQTGTIDYDIDKDFQILRKYYVQSTKPNGDRELYLRAINLFCEKHSDYTKAEVMARAERERHVKLNKCGGENDE
jgi:hypothetical protein